MLVLALHRVRHPRTVVAQRRDYQRQQEVGMNFCRHQSGKFLPLRADFLERGRLKHAVLLKLDPRCQSRTEPWEGVMVFLRRTLILTLTLFLPASSSAQQASSVPPNNGPSLGLVGGLSAGSGNSGGAIGGTIAGVLSDRTSLEGRGVYMDRGPGADALDVSVSLLVNLLTDRRAIPYVAVGGGIYRARFDLDNRRFLGMTGNLPPGAQIVATGGGWGMMGAPGGYPTAAGWMMSNFRWQGATWSGPHYGNGEMPLFYANRLGAMVVPAGGRWGERTFTDPAVTFGGGVRLDLTKSLYVRPDVRALMVVADGDTFTVGTFSVGVGYRF
jgi:hypothetical protein